MPKWTTIDESTSEVIVLNCSILIFDQISGQEEYDEHHSEITQCRFSNSGATIASSDVDGVVKVSMDFF